MRHTMQTLETAAEIDQRIVAGIAAQGLIFVALADHFTVDRARTTLPVHALDLVELDVVAGLRHQAVGVLVAELDGAAQPIQACFFSGAVVVHST